MAAPRGVPVLSPRGWGHPSSSFMSRAGAWGCPSTFLPSPLCLSQRCPAPRPPGPFPAAGVGAARVSLSPWPCPRRRWAPSLREPGCHRSGIGDLEAPPSAPPAHAGVGWSSSGGTPGAGTAPQHPPATRGPPAGSRGGLSGDTEPFPAPGVPPGWKTAGERLWEVGAQPGWGARVTPRGQGRSSPASARLCWPQGDRSAAVPVPALSPAPSCHSSLDTPEPLPDIPPCPENPGMGAGCVTAPSLCKLTPTLPSPGFGGRDFGVLVYTRSCHLRARAEQRRFWGTPGTTWDGHRAGNTWSFIPASPPGMGLPLHPDPQASPGLFLQKKKKNYVSVNI